MILEAKDFAEAQPQRAIDNYALLVGFIAAFAAGVLACRWMIAIVKRSKLDYFAYYCLGVGLIAIGYGLLS
jgi:undecaprenyl-diphosphatase